MGYTYGHKWTDDEVKKSVVTVKNELGLDRMPSRIEILRYYKNNALVCKISKREGGWYKLAEELGLKMKESETNLGKEYEAIVNQMLKDKGNKAIRMSTGFPYDILVNDCVKIDVKVSHLYNGDNGNFYSFRTGKPYATCDVYILVAINDANKKNNIFIIPSVDIINNTQISIGEKNSKYLRYINNWNVIDEYSRFMNARGIK